MHSKSLLCRNWKDIVMLSKPLQIQQPASIVFNYCTQWSYAHTLPTPRLLNFYSKFCKPNKNFQHCKKAISIVIWFLIFHAVDIHIFTKHNWSGSGQNYRWTETTLQVAKDWGTMHEVWGLTKSKHTVLLLWFLLGWFNSSRNYLISTFK